MAVSKRLRYEILRRDNHACRYCGGTAPDVILTVDHVVPVALGGSDAPANLVAACKDCNAGKSAVPAGAALVNDVAQDAMRWSAALQTAFAQAVAAIEARDAYVAEFRGHWNTWRYGEDKTVPLPDDWERSVTKWYGLGLPLTILKDATDSTMRKRKLTGYDAEFRYMAGIVWSTLTELQHQTAALLAVDAPAESLHPCDDPWCNVHGGERQVCLICGQHDCDWLCAYYLGRIAGRSQARRAERAAIDAYDNLSAVCDGAILSEAGL